ncbi:MAG: RNA-binding protein [Chloroflexi bacterium]|nr:RNA-binding protein [Chloroflexota bacterium]MDA8188432.1 RNA-binding protein [Dehalococcoidales bacterium]
MATRLYVGNLPYSATEEGLRQLFGQVGTVVSVDLPADKYTGRPRGFGFVEMDSTAEAEEAVRKFDGYTLDNRSVRVQIAKERPARAPGYRPPVERRYGLGGRREGRRPPGRGRGMAA